MGTNYYAVKIAPTTFESEWRIHIGKSSSGWLFCFHDCEYFHTYPQVKMWLHENVVIRKEYVLMNEYDEIVDVEDFIELVQSKQNDPNCRKNPDNFSYEVRNIDGYRFDDREFC